MSPQLEGELSHSIAATKGEDETARELSKHSPADPFPALLSCYANFPLSGKLGDPLQPIVILGYWYRLHLSFDNRCPLHLFYHYFPSFYYKFVTLSSIFE